MSSFGQKLDFDQPGGYCTAQLKRLHFFFQAYGKNACAPMYGNAFLA